MSASLTAPKPTAPLSPWSDELVPHLSEKDARTLCEKVTEKLRAFGVLPTRIGVSLDLDGFWFTAEINGRNASARTGQGNFTYDAVARELALASVDPGWNTLTIQKD